ncbi:hypothetical protein ACH5RR_008998 [Cinchona calisaya]|uniref:Reverse transcriptase/retrotransposon-derived protein RNase H-like domain-containing protein n=1 Tax=Cinchona calisaya TaxID=153742 RepID=A0ABD3AFE5_9GENT
MHRNVKEFREFLGLAGYYKRFLQSYGKIPKPLIDLTKKNGFKWDDQATKAFQQLKSVMISPLVLAMPNFRQQFILEIDASGGGIGDVLMQNARLIAYFGRLWLLNTWAYQFIKNRCCSIIVVVKWRLYIIGNHFIIKTDHLKHMLEQKISTPCQQKWIAKLLGYDFGSYYKKGCKIRWLMCYQGNLKRNNRK